MVEPAKSYKPEGVHDITPHLVVRGAEEAIAFYQRAFGAELRTKSHGPGGAIMHAELRFGDSIVMLADEFPQWGSSAPPTIGGSPVVINLAVRDIDAVYERAVAAGAKGTMPPADMFWGDRYAKLDDPFGHHWALVTAKEVLTPEEMDQRQKEWMAKFGGGM